MEILDLSLKGLKLIRPDIYKDARGFFCETFRKKLFSEKVFDQEFVQDNHSFSHKNCLRGLHFQKGDKQAKLIFVPHGKIFDVAVDIRKNSPTFGKWEGVILDDVSHEQLLIPGGFAHGFCVLSDTAHVFYKVSAYYEPSLEMGLIWNDPDLNIAWPVKNPLLSEKDQSNPRFKDLWLEQLQK